MQREKSKIMLKLNCIHYKCKWSLKQLPLVSPVTVGYNLGKMGTAGTFKRPSREIFVTSHK